MQLGSVGESSPRERGSRGRRKDAESRAAMETGKEVKGRGEGAGNARR